LIIAIKPPSPSEIQSKVYLKSKVRRFDGTIPNQFFSRSLPILSFI
jgi:hypothetical protein